MKGIQNMKEFSKSIKYIGADDKDLDLFESQYIIPNGVSYNSYVVMDEKIAVMDTVDARKTNEWLANLEAALGGRHPDYLVISHLEPDHAANIKTFTDKYPSAALVGNAKTFAMLPQFFDIAPSVEKLTVKEGDSLSLGAHTLNFVMAPMVHWPEVMVTYESSEKVLFSADGFGKFGALDVEEDWACEARRYYFNIVGKYGGPVQTLLKKAAALDIKTICPLHGPALTENLEYYINLYNTWSSYKPECDGVFIACASVYGNTKNAALKLKEILEAKGCKVAFSDITRDDFAEAVEDAFKYGRVVFAAASYDGGVFPPMEALLAHLKSKAYQNRKVGLIENGSWAPCAARAMKATLEGMKNISVCENTVTIKSAMKDSDIPALEALANELLAD